MASSNRFAMKHLVSCLSIVCAAVLIACLLSHANGALIRKGRAQVDGSFAENNQQSSADETNNHYLLLSLFSSRRDDKLQTFRQSSAECTEKRPCSFMLVADLDSHSFVKDSEPLTFKSYMQLGTLTKKGESDYSVAFTGEPKEMKSLYNEGGRGLELSELLYYKKSLLSFDDRSGIVYQLLDSSKPINDNTIEQTKAVDTAQHFTGEGSALLYPKAILADVLQKGTPHSMYIKGMKIEWATEKDGELYLGSHGTATSSKSGYIDPSKKWIRIMDRKQNFRKVDWTENYDKIARLLGCENGYVVHESASWSPILKKWVFLPRKVSPTPYNPKTDEFTGSSLLILADEHFNNIEKVEISAKQTTNSEKVEISAKQTTNRRGFSSFKFVPGTQDQLILAIKTDENNTDDTQKTFITLFDINGKVFMEDVKVPKDYKYEALEFL